MIPLEPALGGTSVLTPEMLGEEMRAADATGPVVSWSGAYDGGTFSGYQSAGW
ncbi:MAG: hypothetical protein ACK5UT_13115 [Acidobacteriota bacterium]